MTRLNYDGTHWTNDQDIFTAPVRLYGPLAVWQGQNFGGTSAYALLGPDIERPGGHSHNPPTATGAGWDQAWLNAPPGPGTDVTFTTDTNGYGWKRGHLINGEWRGSGSDWGNLVALTTQANANHRTVEARMRNYLQNFRFFDMMGTGHQTYWYALRYWVEAATAPWAFAPAPDELYSYCPNMIRVTWRVVRIMKPVGPPGTFSNSQVNNVRAQLPGLAVVPATTANINNDLPNLPVNNLPAVLTNNLANAAEVGGAVFPLPGGAPPIPAASNNRDGSVEVFQD